MENTFNIYVNNIFEKRIPFEFAFKGKTEKDYRRNYNPVQRNRVSGQKYDMISVVMEYLLSFYNNPKINVLYVSNAAIFKALNEYDPSVVITEELDSKSKFKWNTIYKALYHLDMDGIIYRDYSRYSMIGNITQVFTGLFSGSFPFYQKYATTIFEAAKAYDTFDEFFNYTDINLLYGIIGSEEKAVLKTAYFELKKLINSNRYYVHDFKAVKKNKKNYDLIDFKNKDMIHKFYSVLPIAHKFAWDSDVQLVDKNETHRARYILINYDAIVAIGSCNKNNQEKVRTKLKSCLNRINRAFRLMRQLPLSIYSNKSNLMEQRRNRIEFVEHTFNKSISKKKRQAKDNIKKDEVVIESPPEDIDNSSFWYNLLRDRMFILESELDIDSDVSADMALADLLEENPKQYHDAILNAYNQLLVK